MRCLFYFLLQQRDFSGDVELWLIIFFIRLKCLVVAPASSIIENSIECVGNSCEMSHTHVKVYVR